MLTVVGFGVLGLLIGSFINAVVWRLHQRFALRDARLASKGATSVDERRATSDAQRELSISKGHSMCPQCRHRLAAADLIPVISWLWLGGKCRYCSKPISWQYPLVELLTAGLFVLSYYSLLTPHPALLAWINLIFWLYFLASLIILAVYDLYWYILPDVVLLSAIGVALARLVVGVAAAHSFSPVLSPLLAALAAGGAFYLVAWVSNGRWMGGGDIKLAFFMGLVLGLGKTGLAMFLAFNSAAVIGVFLIAVKLKSRRDHIPFGPFLVGVTVVAALYGQYIIGWYLHLSGI